MIKYKYLDKEFPILFKIEITFILVLTEIFSLSDKTLNISGIIFG